MDARHGHGIEVRHEPQLEVTRSGPDVVPDSAAAHPTRRRSVRRPVLLAGLLAAAVAVVTVVGLLVWSGGEEDVVATPPVGPAARPAGPAPLGMTVAVPARVVAGEETTLTVRWTDGSGTFSGTTEEWGDGVGTSSLGMARCDAGTPAADSSGGTYDVTHTWSEPGTYKVVMGLATYTCEAGTPAEEQVSRTLTVDVGAGR